MPQSFDIALVGAGPTAFAAIGALQNKGKSIALVTGVSQATYVSKHAKIASVCYELKRPAQFVEPLYFPDGSDVFSTTEIGGLANYWGQQLLEYGPQDPWQGGKDWESYQRFCNLSTRDLCVDGGQKIGELEIVSVGSIGVHRSRLLLGTKTAPQAGLGAIAQAMKQRIAETPQIEVLDTRVLNLSLETAGTVSLALEDGRTLVARKVLLAAGVRGTSGLLSRSLPIVKQITFSDHLPYMLYTLGLEQILPKTEAAEQDHFNVLSLIRRTPDREGRCDFFASVYRMSRAPLSLIFSSLGIGPWLRGWRAGAISGALIDLIRPVQIWTPFTTGLYQYTPGQDRITLRSNPDPIKDSVLSDIKSALKAACVRVYLSRTPPGHGFHYHDLRLSCAKGQAVPVDIVLREAFDGRVLCLDASALSEIGCMPHTLTAMAQAYARTQRL